ncbi:MAG: hypothetical protein CML66_07510 [Rhodobacteraceae bacterium]|nr:hypothetical protein [Paracoccaceae bacterium]MAY48012.1 hypothetical protein [Paracoccaceae bacterium]
MTKTATRRHTLGLGLAALTAVGLTTLGFTGPARAADFPTKPITVVVAFAAGGGTDTAVRALTQSLSAELGQPILVQNVTGAGGGVATGQVARAKPDGYTLLATNSTSITLAPMVQPTMYKTDDFVHIGMIAEFQNAVFTGAGKPFSTLDELVSDTEGSGSPIKAASYMPLDRLVMQYVAKQKDAPLVLVPVNGANGAVQAVLSGDVDIAFSGGSWAPIVDAGDAKALFAASYNRLKNAPDLVSMKDLGFPFGATSFISLSAPKGTPQDVVDTIAAALEVSLQSEVAQKVAKARNMDMTFAGPQEATQIMDAEHEAYAKIIETVGAD